MLNVETTAEFKVWPRNRRQANKHFTESQRPEIKWPPTCCGAPGHRYNTALNINKFFIEILFNKPHTFYQIFKNQQQNNMYLKVLSLLHARTSSLNMQTLDNLEKSPHLHSQ